MPKHQIQVPGDHDPESILAVPEKVETVEELKNQLAVANRQIAKLRSAEPVPNAVYMPPDTPRAAAVKATSQWAHITSKELMALIDSGQVPEPETSVFCKDGWYARRRTA